MTFLIKFLVKKVSSGETIVALGTSKLLKDVEKQVAMQPRFKDAFGQL